MGGKWHRLAGRKSNRKAKRTKGMLTRQKEKSEWWESRRERNACKEPQTLTEGQGGNKSLGSKPGVRSGKLRLKYNEMLRKDEVLRREGGEGFSICSALGSRQGSGRPRCSRDTASAPKSSDLIFLKIFFKLESWMFSIFTKEIF